MSASKTLLLVRHAKSSWKDTTLSDMDRPLNKRGLRDAPKMGRRLLEQSLHPDFMVSSPAVRALTTARMMAAEVEYTEDIAIADDLYGAAPRDVLEIIAGFPDRYQTAVVVTHNPVITELANRFANQTIDNVPTCGVLVVATASWPAVRQGQLVNFDYPKKTDDFDG